MYIEGDVPVMTYGNNCNGNQNNGWGDWSWIVGLAIIGALFGGNGFGFGGGNRGGFGGDSLGWQLGRLATTNDVASGFSTSEIMSDLNDIILGQAQMQNFINQGFAGVNQTITNGFAGVNNAICTLGYQNQAGFNAIGTQLAQCCCDIRTELMQNRYLNERQTCDILAGQTAQTRAILDYLTNEKIEGLRAENTSLKGQISNERQSQYIVSQLREPCPVPAYLTCDPRVPFNYGQYSHNNGCGCGCN